MTLDDAASQRQHASDIADAAFSETPRPESPWVFINAVRQAVLAEREACAKIADGFTDSPDDHESGTAGNIAATIRARSEMV